MHLKTSKKHQELDEFLESLVKGDRPDTLDNEGNGS
jgi:hypothetical protein